MPATTTSIAVALTALQSQRDSLWSRYQQLLADGESPDTETIIGDVMTTFGLSIDTIRHHAAVVAEARQAEREANPEAVAAACQAVRHATPGAMTSRAARRRSELQAAAAKRTEICRQFNYLFTGAGELVNPYDAAHRARLQQRLAALEVQASNRVSDSLRDASDERRRSREAMLREISDLKSLLAIRP